MIYKSYKTICISSEIYNCIYKSTIFHEDNLSQLTQSPDYPNEGSENIYLATYYDQRIVSITIVKLYKFLFPLFFFARINRGPHLLNAVSSESYKLIIKSIYKLLKSKRIYFVIFASNILYKTSFLRPTFWSLKLPFERWSSSYIKLDKESNLLLAGFKSKWRNTLKKGLKTVLVEEVFKDYVLDLIIEQYQEMAQAKSFTPINRHQIIKWWLNNFKIESQLPILSIYRAFLSADPKSTIGVVGIINYAHTSQYLFGFSNREGRSKHANSVLLWHAILESLSKGNKIFDLGGLSKSTPSGIRKFKNGINGKNYSLMGEYLSTTIIS